MECTQRLECTQELYESSHCDRVCPEQIGFLGICGVKHPVKQGPNKIGRDPQTCNIVLNLNSISRQHAVINVLNHTEYMLMDLDSANKTKLMNKVLPAYIPHPLKNGDLVQFGDIFGVFRLLEEDNELPMTQAIDIPETPISAKHISRINKAPITTIPESPDVSDREESFIAPSQQQGEKCFRNSNGDHFIKPTDKVISIQPLGSNKIDNVYWSSSKKSLSLNSQFNNSLNDSTLSKACSERSSNNISIHNMETQPAVAEANDSTDSIYTAKTQIPNVPSSIHSADTQVPTVFNDNAETRVTSNIHSADTEDLIASPSVYTADTQIPSTSTSIHNLNTQLPESTNLPEVCKIDNQQEMQFNLFTSNKQNKIFEADTQYIAPQINDKTKLKNSPEKTALVDQVVEKLNKSDEVILFDEVECQEFDNEFASQPLLPMSSPIESTNDKKQNKNESVEKKNIRKGVIIHSDSSTDCEDIDMLPTQKITEKNVNNDDDDLTDCEDIVIEAPTKIGKPSKAKTKLVNFEDMLTQVIDDDIGENKVQTIATNKVTAAVDLEDMLTQVIVPELNDTVSSKKDTKTVTNNVNVEDIPTQIIVAGDEVIIAEKQQTNTSFEDMPTQVIDDCTDNNTLSSKEKPKLNENPQDLVSPFKIPLISPIKLKRKDIKVITPKSKPVLNIASPISIPDDDDNYYSATQDILDDLCSQQDSSLKKNKGDDDVLPSSVEDYEVGKRFPHLENLSPRKRTLTTYLSTESSDGEEKVNNFVSKLSSEQIRDMVGVEPQVATLKRIPSDASDVELTPKKVRPIKFMDIDLPSSQEIKTSVSVYNKTAVTESSSESEVENDSEECTPILYRKKKKAKADAKVDLTKVFEAESIPTRVITRVRKPTSKLQNSDDTKKLTSNILKPKYLTEQEDEINKDIITENITRLKSKSEKSKKKDVKKEEGNTSGNVKNEKENATKKDSKHRTKSHKNTSKTDKSNKTKQNEDKRVNETNTEESTSTNNKSIEKVVVNNQRVDLTAPKTSRSTRSTRSTRKDDKELSTLEKLDGPNENHSRSGRRINKKTIQIDLEEVMEIRRSARQNPAKKTKEKVQKLENSTESIEKIKKPVTRRGRHPKHEQSTVYSISSDSSAESPRNAKRSATGILDPPSPKRTRSVITANTSSLRSTPARLNKAHYVLFTAFPSEEIKAKLEKLGAVVVSDVNACTVVLTMQVKRTFKLLCAVGLGRPIVGPNWVQACVDTNMIVDPWLYILKDEAAEKRFHFNLERTLVGKRNFLKGFTVSATPNVMPSAPEMKLIVESSGGGWKEGGGSWVCVSCSADRAQWPALRRRGASVVSTEFILGGVLRQKADVTANKLL